MTFRQLRDPKREDDWLSLAELRAGRSGFTEHALMRLAAGERAYGDRWAARTVDELLGELTEEAADLGAWGVLALQALSAKDAAGGRRSRRVAEQLEAAITCGAEAHSLLIQARRALAERDELHASRPGPLQELPGASASANPGASGMRPGAVRDYSGTCPGTSGTERSVIREPQRATGPAYPPHRASEIRP